MNQDMIGAHEQRGWRSRAQLGLWWPAAVIAGLLIGSPIALAQGPSSFPVYVPDSPTGQEGLRRAIELSNAGGHAEAVRVLQRVLDEHGQAVTASKADPDLYVPLRQVVQDELLARPELLKEYRAIEGPTAQAALAGGAADEAERTRLLTESGFDAALQLAQGLLEDARFAAAWHMIRQLDRHPDRKGARARQAARLLELISAYITNDTPIRDAVDTTLRSWQRDAGLDIVGARALERRPVVAQGVSVFDPAPGANLDGILPRPLASATLGPGAHEGEDVMPPPSSGREKVLNAAPCIAGDLAIVNDSQLVTAWNRFTLKRAWQVEVHAPMVEQAISTGAGLDDLNTVQVEGDVAIAVTGLSIRSRAATERAILAIDVHQGDVLWSTSIPQLNVPELVGSTIRGQPVIDEGVVVLTAIKHLPQQRLIGAYSFGLDLRTGALRWVTPMGSIGALPFGWNVGSMDASAHADGVTYRCEQVGVISAIESATGRVQWIRKMDAPPARNMRSTMLVAWLNNKPQVVGNRLYTLSPARDTVLCIDRATGRVEQRGLASWFDEPDYLLVLNDTLIGVSEGRLMAQPLARFGTDAELSELAPVQALGRVSISGDVLVVPTFTGLSTVTVPDGVMRDVRLNETGQTAVVDGQVVVADDDKVHTYARWEVAERHLRQRMDDDPLDPEPSITLAQLSYQANHPESILPAVDHALTAIDSAVLEPASDAARRKLFQAVLGMVSANEANTMMHLDVERRAELLRRLERCAATPDERIEHLMAKGAFHQASGDAREAIAQYQHVLGLALTEDPGGANRGRLAQATSRIRELVRREGQAVYATFDAEASAQHAALAGAAPAPELEALAQRYPAAHDTVTLWAQASASWREHNSIGRALHALDEAILASASLEPIDASPRLALEGEALTALMHANRPALTLRRLRDLQERAPGAAVAIDGVDMPIEDAVDAVASIVDQRPQRARLGPALGATRTLSGWTLFDEPFPRAEHVSTNRVLMRQANGSPGMLAIDASDGVLRPEWVSPRQEEPLRETSDRVYFARRLDAPPGLDQAVVCRDAETGDVVWETDGFETFFEDDAANDARAGQRVQTPRLMRVDLGELTHYINEDVVVSVDRAGRAVALDAATGTLRWKQDHLVDVVHDAALSADVLLVGGGMLRPGQRLDSEHLAIDRLPRIVALDCRTGEVLSTLDAPSAVRWVVATPEQDMILGLSDQLMSFDPYRGVPRWAAVAEELVESRSAVATPGRVIVRSLNNEVWQVDSSLGSLSAGRLALGDRVGQGFDFIEVAALGQRIGIATAHGVGIFDPDGTVVGLDAAVDRMAPAAFGHDRFVDATMGSLAADSEHLVSQLTVYALPDGRAVAQADLSMWTEPTRVGLVDGLIIVSGSFNSVLVEAPLTEAVDEPKPVPTP
ncbi:MAG: PQQ-binding-like beta-propeller repeat protein [Phycisphaerales bacterium]|nr:PQQ-binding-like beta-propeller repeat protein [Phycisphaerales bacterium]